MPHLQKPLLDARIFEIFCAYVEL